MCGGGDKASKRAEASEAERQARIRQQTSAIDTAFAGREPQYAEFVNALRDFYGTDLKKQKTVADRNLKFSLARGGLTGGSAAVDAGTLLGEEFQEGVLKSDQEAQSRAAELRSADEASKMSLISLASTGSDIGSGATRAANAMSSNLKSAQATGTSTGLGDIFGNTAKIYQTQQEAAARRRGLKESELYASPFSRGT